jgi:hypothetical protein
MKVKHYQAQSHEDIDGEDGVYTGTTITLFHHYIYPDSREKLEIQCQEGRNKYTYILSKVSPEKFSGTLKDSPESRLDLTRLVMPDGRIRFQGPFSNEGESSGTWYIDIVKTEEFNSDEVSA